MQEPELVLEATAYTIDQLLSRDWRQIALAGRSNVGKSSLINAMARRRALAKVSSTPGKTRSVNYYAVKPDGSPDVFTAGPDLKPGTPDDLRPEQESYDPGTDWTNGWLKVEDRLPDIEKILSERDRKE